MCAIVDLSGNGYTDAVPDTLATQPSPAGLAPRGPRSPRSVGPPTPENATIGSAKVSGDAAQVTVSCPSASSANCSVKVVLVVFRSILGIKAADVDYLARALRDGLANAPVRATWIPYLRAIPSPLRPNPALGAR
jgi:hypothetical protein